MTDAAPPAPRTPRLGTQCAAFFTLLVAAAYLTGTQAAGAQAGQPRLVVFEAFNSPT